MKLGDLLGGLKKNESKEDPKQAPAHKNMTKATSSMI